MNKTMVAAALAASAMAGLSTSASAQSAFVTVGPGYPGRYQSYDPHGGYNSYDRYRDRGDAWAARQRWEQHRRWE